VLKPVRRRAASIFEFLQPVSQQSVENIRIQELERRHHHIGRQKLVILAYAYAFHPGGAGCFDAVLRVFDNNAMLARATPNLVAAMRNTSGSGSPRCTSSADTMD